MKNKNLGVEFRKGDYFDDINEMSSFDAMNFDSQNWEDAERKMIGMARKNPVAAGKMITQAARAIAANPAGGVDRNAQGLKGGLGGSRLTGIFSLVVRRLSATITEDLPCPLFGYFDSLAAWAKVLNQQLPAGVTVGAFQNGILTLTSDPVKFAAFITAAWNKTQTVRIAFTQGVNIDIVEISCTENPYPILLQASALNNMLINGIRIRVNDTSMQDQLSVSIKPYRRTLLGKTSDDSTPLDTFFSPMQFQTGIIDYEVNTPIDGETTMCFDLIQAAVTVNMSVFVNNSNRWNALRAAAKASR